MLSVGALEKNKQTALGKTIEGRKTLFLPQARNGDHQEQGEQFSHQSNFFNTFTTTE